MVDGAESARYATENCIACGAKLRVQVCRSAAGYYIGTTCDNCGPHARFSGYTRKRKDAEAVLNAFLAKPSKFR